MIIPQNTSIVTLEFDSQYAFLAYYMLLSEGLPFKAPLMLTVTTPVFHHLVILLII